MGIIPPAARRLSRARQRGVRRLWKIAHRWPLAAAGALCCAALLTALTQAVIASQGNPTPWLWHFVSAPDLQPVKIRADRRTDFGKLARGDFLLSSTGALILDSHLQPVWYHVPPQGSFDYNLQEQTLGGKPVLMWWEGSPDKTGSGAGSLYVVNEHYRLIATVRPRGGWLINLHDALIHGRDVWLTGERIMPVSAARYGVSAIDDNAVQEYDLRTGRLLRTWDALAHVPPGESKIRRAGTWDPYHANSIQLVGSHEFLVSMRNTSAAYLVDIRSGRIVWTLGGKRSSFKLPGMARFSFQHDVSLHPGGVVAMFDDRCCAEDGSPRGNIAAGPSRGLVLKLHFKTRTVSLVHQYLHRPSITGAFLGSTQVLANGNVLVGWPAPYFTEYSSSGTPLLDAKLEHGYVSYRARLTPNWVGTPFYPPSVAVIDNAATKTVYASWNGATQVAAWDVLVGSTTDHLKLVARKRKTGFETAIRLPARSFKYLWLNALGARGRPIGHSFITVS